MQVVEDYGIPDGSVTNVTRDTFVSCLHEAQADEYFGLPAWCRERGFESVRADRFWIFGTTGFSSAFFYCVDHERIIGFVDDCRASKEFRGRQCVSGEEFLRLHSQDPDVVCISGAQSIAETRHFRALAMQSGARMLNFEQAVRVLHSPRLDYRLADHRPYITANIDRYLALDERLGDALSKETLWRVTLFHLTTFREYYHRIERPYDTLYFHSGLFEVSPNERFVDCGASIGESISNLLAITNFRIDRAWLVEPDKYNVNTLNKMLERFDHAPGAVSSRIKLIPAAVGEEPGSTMFRHMGGHGGYVLNISSGVEGAVEEVVPIVRLDDVVDATPTFIKMDIEGSELPALRGAADLIRKHRPKLAVSAYHRASDLVTLSEYVLSLRPDYRVGLRHHTQLRWDTCLYFY
jgi:FkbM family methyltransferase